MKDRLNTDPHIQTIFIKPNRSFPNSKLPVLIYKEALNLPFQKKKATQLIQHTFARHNWSNSWGNGIYDFHHYHSVTHECLAICKGWAYVILGGPGGRRIKLSAGDVIILPAGVGHMSKTKSLNFFCVGAYPGGKDYDIKKGERDELEQAIKNIKRLSVPKLDPVFGKEGFLRSYWK